MATLEAEHLYAPPEPPPLLSQGDITDLCWNGWIGFDLPEHLERNIANLQKAALTFFNQSKSDKVRDFRGKNSGEEGYYEVPGEKEYITLRRSINDKLYIELLSRNVWSDVAHLLSRMLCDLSRAGGLPVDAWDPVVKGSLRLPDPKTSLLESTSLLRLFRYEPHSGIAEKHSDLGLLTMCVGQGEGLELLDRKGLSMQWISAPKCTILVGETLREISSKHIRTGIHRVVANPSGRQSFVFAMRPNLGTTIKLKHFGGHGQLNLMEAFLNIKTSKYNVNEKREIRERQIQDKAIKQQASKQSPIKQEAIDVESATTMQAAKHSFVKQEVIDLESDTEAEATEPSSVKREVIDSEAETNDDTDDKYEAGERAWKQAVAD